MALDWIVNTLSRRFLKATNPVAYVTGDWWCHSPEALSQALGCCQRLQLKQPWSPPEAACLQRKRKNNQQSNWVIVEHKKSSTIFGNDLSQSSDQHMETVTTINGQSRFRRISFTLHIVCCQAQESVLLGGLSHSGVIHREIKASSGPYSNCAAVSHGSVTRGGDPVLSEKQKCSGNKEGGKI